MCSTKAVTLALGGLSANDSAASNSASIASRSRSACSPPGPPRSAAGDHRCSGPGLPGLPEDHLDTVARGDGRACTFPRCEPDAAAGPRRRRARRRNAPLRRRRRWRPTARRSDRPGRRRAPHTRRNRRNAAGSAPPIGPVSKLITASGSSSWPSAASRADPNAATARWRCNGGSRCGVTTGTPGRAEARRSAGSARRTDRTTTAIDDHGTSSKRWARRGDRRRRSPRSRRRVHLHRRRGRVHILVGTIVGDGARVGAAVRRAAVRPVRRPPR